MKKIIIIFLCAAMSANSSSGQVVFCGNPESDLYKLLLENNFEVDRYTIPSDAIRSGKVNAPVFIVADHYPEDKVTIDPRWLTLARKKNMRLYIEYPASLPGLHIPDTAMETRLERGIVISDRLGGNLRPMGILGINGCHILPVTIDSPLIVLGKVAGFDVAAYGIEDVKTYPVLFKQDNEMIALTKLSNFATGRYEPSARWKEVWEYILSWMTDTPDLHLRRWISYVRPMYKPEEALPSDAKHISIGKGIQWFYNARLFIDSDWQTLWLKYQGDGSSPTGPPVPNNFSNGNGTLGILEGPASEINYDGSQRYRYWVRADDQGEAAYALAAAAHFLDKPTYDSVATNLLNFMFYNSGLRGGKKRDTTSSAFGLIGWAVTHPGVFYGDDNARCMLGAIGASAYMRTDKWDQDILENILANFRTTGKEGFRGSRLEEADILDKGWQYYQNRDIINPHPHFESWMWACYLWLYDKTGYEPLLEKTKNAIKITMDGYPGQWKWTNGIQQERARMILPLAWLVRIEDTPEHRKWLEVVVSDLLKNQVGSGAIREELGAGKGQFGRTPSNAAYGKTEAPLIFENGDPVADMLYTSNFAFFSLNEAAHATGNPRYASAVTKLSDFLTRIQVSSKKFSDVDGAWFRAFDYRDWNYWASNADAGWGAWATLTGWIQSWIVSTQVLLAKNQSYWDITRHSQISKNMISTARRMLDEKYK